MLLPSDFVFILGSKLIKSLHLASVYFGRSAESAKFRFDCTQFRFTQISSSRRDSPRASIELSFPICNLQSISQHLVSLLFQKTTVLISHDAATRRLRLTIPRGTPLRRLSPPSPTSPSSPPPCSSLPNALGEEKL